MSGEQEMVQALRDLLEKSIKMLDSALCPKIDHEEAKAWIEQRNALVAKVQEFLQGEKDG